MVLRCVQSAGTSKYAGDFSERGSGRVYSSREGEVHGPGDIGNSHGHGNRTGHWGDSFPLPRMEEHFLVFRCLDGHVHGSAGAMVRGNGEEHCWKWKYQGAEYVDSSFVWVEDGLMSERMEPALVQVIQRPNSTPPDHHIPNPVLRRHGSSIVFLPWGS